MTDNTWWQLNTAWQDQARQQRDVAALRRKALHIFLDTWLAPATGYWVGRLHTTPNIWRLTLGFTRQPHPYHPWQTASVLASAPFLTVWTGSLNALIYVPRSVLALPEPDTAIRLFWHHEAWDLTLAAQDWLDTLLSRIVTSIE